MKIAVLQARHADDPMLEHERRCFISATGLGGEDFHFVNLAERVPVLSEIVACRALMIGGSGHFSVTDPGLGFLDPLAELLRQVVADGFPTFASCFGYQALVRSLGGRVITDPGRSEVGSYTVRLTDDGRRDELFGRLPDEFVAQMGHKDRASAMPPELLNLAASELSPLQALRIPDRLVWASQFHPELDQRTNYDRYLAYIERYRTDGEASEDFPSMPSPETSTLLQAFLELVSSLG